jgi:Holliday junction resolvase RusA-like endonuclease
MRAKPGLTNDSFARQTVHINTSENIVWDGGKRMIKLPKPPSTNHIYGFTSRGGFARSYITKDGVDWFDTSATILADYYSWLLEPIAENVYIKIELFTARHQDIDNIIKPILDLIAGICLDCKGKFSSRKACHCGKNRSVLQNDKYVTQLEVTKFKVKHVEEEKVNVLLKNVEKMV